MHTGLWWESLSEKIAQKPRHRWKDYYEINLQEMGWKGIMDWVDLAQDRNKWQNLVNSVMNLHIGDNVRSFLVG
jgi:hypothetical protein